MYTVLGANYKHTHVAFVLKSSWALSCLNFSNASSGFIPVLAWPVPQRKDEAFWVGWHLV